MWVPLVENNEADRPGADYFVKQEVDRMLAADPDIDTIVLACTHYPHLYEKIRRYTPDNIRIVCQGDIVAASLHDYLRRHPEIERLCGKNGSRTYLTTENPEKFADMASLFLGEPVSAERVELT